jgi:hypothetical protein
MQHTHVWECQELVFHSEQQYKNPFTEVVLQAEFFGPSGQRLLLFGFWDGEGCWKIRFAPTEVGRWSWRTHCSAIADAGLHARTGELDAAPWSSAAVTENPNRRGFVRIHPSGRYFVYADGTPFYWLGDTLWAGFLGRVKTADYLRYLHDRKAKGFTLIQVVLGRPAGDASGEFHESYWQGAPGDYGNEGGMPFTRRYDLINPRYFQAVDEKLSSMLVAGFLPCLFGLWGTDLKEVGVEHIAAYWRYLVARYAAYNVFWSVSGEYFFTADEAAWRYLGQVIDAADPYQHPTSAHSTAPHSGSRHYQAEPWYDFNLIQVGHCYSLRQFLETLPNLDYHAHPVKPVIMSESWYENHATCLGESEERFTDRDIRLATYVPLLQGCIGQTYGAHGIWCWANDRDAQSAEFNAPATWQHDLALPASAQMRHLRTVMESVCWWALEPHQEFVSVVDPQRAYCAAAPGQEYVVYVTGGPSHVKLFLPPLTTTPDAKEYPGRWFNPRTGAWLPATAIGQWYGSWLLWSATTPDAQDWVLVVKRAAITCGW